MQEKINISRSSRQFERTSTVIRPMDSKAPTAEVQKELFSIKSTAIICVIHIIAPLAFLEITISNVISWTIAHLFFGTIGASIGLHRYSSHRSFNFTNNSLKTFVLTISTLCFQGGPIFWASTHRAHHRKSESFGDPHSAQRGFLWSHILWMFYSNPNGFSYVRSLRVTMDLKRDKVINFLETQSVNINLVFLCFLFIACFFTNNTILFFWIGPLRIVTVWHSTWMINSFAHGAKFSKPKSTKLRNSPMLCLLIGGDGNHLYHHNNPSNVRHTDQRFHLDYGFLILKIFRKLGMVTFKTDYDGPNKSMRHHKSA